MSHPVSYFHFCYLSYHGDLATALKIYRKPNYLFYHKGDWRRLLDVVVHKTKKDSYGNVVPMTVLVTFSGLTKPREMVYDNPIPHVYDAELHKDAINDKRWYGQKDGPPLSEGMYQRYDRRAELVKKYDFSTPYQYHKEDGWATERGREKLYAYRYYIMKKTQANNKAFFSKRVPKISS